MSGSRWRLAGLVCLASIICLTVVSSSASAGWSVNGTELSGSAALVVTAEVTEPARLAFSTITIECSGTSLEGVAPQIASPDIVSATGLKFSGCGATGGSCSLAGTTVGTVPVLALLREASSADLAVLKPKTKTVLATLQFLGASCAFGSELQPVTGAALMVLPTGQTENTLQEVIANTPSGELKVGSSSAILAGRALVELASGAEFAFDLGVNGGMKFTGPNKRFKKPGEDEQTVTLENTSRNTEYTVTAVKLNASQAGAPWFMLENTGGCIKKFAKKTLFTTASCTFKIKYIKERVPLPSLETVGAAVTGQLEPTYSLVGV